MSASKKRNRSPENLSDAKSHQPPVKKRKSSRLNADHKNEEETADSADKSDISSMSASSDDISSMEESDDFFADDDESYDDDENRSNDDNFVVDDDDDIEYIDKEQKDKNKKKPIRQLGIKHKFKCTKCRRTFTTNRGLASHQRAHKKKVPKPLQLKSEQQQPQNNISPQVIATDTKKNQDYKQPLTKLPNINNWMNIANLADLKNLNLTRLKMPEIKTQQKYQINNQNVSVCSKVSKINANETDYKYHCIKCNAAFFYQTDLMKHDSYSECIHRPYLCPFCEKPFKSCLAVKKHCS